MSISTYRYNDSYIVDIQDNGDSYDAWLYHKNYGIKMLMFGVPAEQNSKEEFPCIVFKNIEPYIKIYKGSYED